MNDIETSDPPRRPAARRHLRGPGPKALAAVVLSGVALVILGGLTLKTLLVLAAVGVIVAAARRSRPQHGRVRIGGEVWSARAYVPEQVIPVGAVVDVFEIRGATALVHAEETTT